MGFSNLEHNIFSGISILKCFLCFLHIQCASGYYADSTGSTTCTICPAGSQCADPTVSPVSCSTGEVSDAFVKKIREVPHWALTKKIWHNS